MKQQLLVIYNGGRMETASTEIQEEAGHPAGNHSSFIIHN
jgi:hypothetical protein